ncbi:helix-turn-helix domain-containing protein [Mycobacterium avium]|uniref:helix-turn-helix domain-containing protein n=1 Tax=Mycobacterium avium TaxID=1764 RepID=UPI001156DAFC|nr:helix-turn-helix domain-containing protein [Mycobacterium avium]
MHVIRTYMNNDTLSGFVKQETLARDTGLSLRQVQRQIADNVKAGWLEVAEQGHSARKANVYRLTYPTQMTTDMSTQGRRICHADDDGYVVPTTPSTSPGSSPKRRTTPGRGDRYVAIPDPKGSGGYSPVLSTAPHDDDRYVAIGDGDTSGRDDGRSVALTEDEQEEIRDEYRKEIEETEVFTLAQTVTVLSDEEAAEQRLIAAMVGGPIPACTARGVAGVNQRMTDAVVVRLINSGAVIHDKGAKTLSLA